MANIKRKWDLLTDEQKQDSIQQLVNFFESERDEEIGLIAAEVILDSVLENVAEAIYNRGVSDAKNLLHQKLEDLDVDLDLLFSK